MIPVKITKGKDKGKILYLTHTRANEIIQRGWGKETKDGK